MRKFSHAPQGFSPLTRQSRDQQTIPRPARAVNPTFDATENDSKVGTIADGKLG
jgi:hypothetical protein